MNEKNRNSSHLLFNLTKNMVALAGLFSLFLVLFFITGNFQNFQDSTQSMILSALGISSIFFAISSVIGIVESIVMFFIKEAVSVRGNILFLILMIICLVLSISFLSMSLILGVLTEGL
ncbi:MAG: hypothetical protein MJ182_05360 [Treponema sp.]|nr:hypothetical protein [Treponema sp.]